MHVLLLWRVVESFSACTNTKAALVCMCCCSGMWLNLFQHAQTRYCSAVCLLVTTTPKARYCSIMWLQAFEHAQAHRKQTTALSSVFECLQACTNTQKANHCSQQLEFVCLQVCKSTQKANHCSQQRKFECLQACSWSARASRAPVLGSPSIRCSGCSHLWTISWQSAERCTCTTTRTGITYDQIELFTS